MLICLKRGFACRQHTTSEQEAPRLQMISPSITGTLLGRGIGQSEKRMIDRVGKR